MRFCAEVCYVWNIKRAGRMTQRRPLRLMSFVNFALNQFKGFLKSVLSRYNAALMLTCRYEIQAYFRSIYWSCSAANAVESRSFTIGLFIETKLFRLFWFYKISDVCYKTQRNTLLPDHLKRRFINLQPVLTQKQWKIRQRQLKKKWEITSRGTMVNNLTTLRGSSEIRRLSLLESHGWGS